ncbi:MAG: DUF6065 family protein [Woeseiaceae bacterium]|nr:DUF6065 family protein [Woeseiaceae bacterium]
MPAVDDGEPDWLGTTESGRVHCPRKFEAVRQPLGADRKLYQQYVDWRDDRLAFNEKLKEAGSDAQKERWQRKYMMGRDMADRTFAGHETKLHLQEFKRR